MRSSVWEQRLEFIVRITNTGVRRRKSLKKGKHYLKKISITNNYIILYIEKDFDLTCAVTL